MRYSKSFQKNESFSNALSGFISDGFPVAVCCGTNAWSSLSGNPEVSSNNLFNAAKAMRKANGLGLINANWSAQPSMTHVTFAWPAFLMTACLGWNAETPPEYLKKALPDLLDAHIFGCCGYNLGKICVLFATFCSVFDLFEFSPRNLKRSKTLVT